MPTFRGDDSAPTITVEEAQARLLQAVLPLEEEAVELSEALGRVLREEIRAPYDLPPSDNSAMDGYAVRSIDVQAASSGSPVRLAVVADVAAETSPGAVLAPATAARIMTGGTIPAGCDAVVRVEETDGGEREVAVFRAPRAGENIRRRGEDVREGDLLLRGGVPIAPGDVSVLAATRKRRVLVGRRPVVAILSTGNELVDIDAPLESGSIPNSNSYAIAAFVARAGGIASSRGIVRDSRPETIGAIEAAFGAADLVVSSGGVSAGAFDFVRDALDAVGAEVLFWRVAMKPGKPVLAARLGTKLYLGLPGNPASSMVSFLLFVAPLIRRLCGESVVMPPAIDVRTSAQLQGSADRTTFARVRVVASGGELVAHPMPRQGSHVSSSMAGANGLAVLPGGGGTLSAGSLVRVLLIDMPFQHPGA